MKNTVVFLLCLLMICCNSNKEISGKVQRQSISFTYFYGVPDDKYDELIKEIYATLDTIKIDDYQYPVLMGLSKVHERGVLRQGHFALTEDGTNNQIILYVDSVEYEQKKKEAGIDSNKDFFSKDTWLAFKGELLYEANLPNDKGTPLDYKVYYTDNITQIKATDRE